MFFSLLSLLSFVPLANSLALPGSKLPFSREKSAKIFEKSKTLFPGGVNSPVRAFTSVGGQPIVFDKVEGAHITDVDGNRYLDFVGSWGPAILGHAHAEVRESVIKAMQRGLSFGALSKEEGELGEKVRDAMPHLEKLRFTTSGTEACMSALRLARAFTKRDFVIKFDGCYHGHADSFLVSAGSGVATFENRENEKNNEVRRSLPGVLSASSDFTLVARYNDLSSVEKLLSAHPVAAVFIEPVVGNSGFILPEDDFLIKLKALTEKYGTLLVIDEVMTGFRVAFGGAQQKFGVKGDLTTLGKVIGGGMSVAAFGGRADVMDLLSPLGPVYQAGTLSGNHIAMTAGSKTLEILKRDEKANYEKLGALSKRLITGLEKAGKETGVPVTGGSVGGMMGIFFTDKKVRNFDDAKTSDLVRFGKWHRGMLERGVYLAPSQFEAMFVSLAHTEEDIDNTIEIAKDVLKTL